MSKCKTEPWAGAPFVVVVDTREQIPYMFGQVPCDEREIKAGRIASVQNGVACLPVPTVVAGLKQGDYSILGYEDQIAIERKSKEDLYSTIASGRDRFERELARLNSMGGKLAQGTRGYVVVEAEISDIVNEPPPFTKLRSKTILRSVIAWQHRYPFVKWWFLPGREVAEVIVYRTLDRWYRDCVLAEEKGEEGAAS
jgi:DNA excision repair protein ERCC-4